MNKNLKKIGNFILLALITGVVLYFSLKDNYEKIINQIININKLWLLVAFVLVFGFWFFKAFVLRILASKYDKEFSFKEALKIKVAVNFFNAVTPFATGGQPWEVYAIKKKKVKFADATNIVLQNSIIYQIALVLLGCIAFVYNYFFHLFPSSNILSHLVTFGFIINLLVIVGLFLVAYAKRVNHFIVYGIIKLLAKIKIVKNYSKTVDKFSSYLEEFHEGANKLLENKKDFCLMILFHLLSLTSLYLVPLVILYGTGDYTSFTGIESIVSSAYVMLIGSFVPIPGGTGGLEYGFIVFYGTFIKGHLLKTLMLLWRFITYYFGMIVGAIVLNFKGKKNKK